MGVESRGVRSVRHAITDVYDEERRTFLVRFPRWFIAAFGSERSGGVRPDWIPGQSAE